MKRTPEDRRFAESFADALRPHIEREKQKGKSLKKIAAMLGVTAWGLQKQLSGGAPSIRTVARAYKLYGVSVDYDGMAVTPAITANGKRHRDRTSEAQMLLPFEIIAHPPSARLELKRVPKRLRTYRLQIVVARAS
jgi:transcriptional regulator with XRE-family HTH domain